MAAKTEEPISHPLGVGLTAGSQSWSQGCTSGFSAELVLQVPYRTGRQTGSRVRDWAWRNKFLAPE